MTTSPVVGRVLVWPGGSLWIGRSSGVTSTHAHHAIQTSIALEGSFQLQTPGSEAWTEYAGAVVPSHLHHTLRASDAFMATIFAEPESPEGRALLDRFGGGAVRSLPEALRREAAATMVRAHADPRDDAGLVAAAQEVTALLTSGIRRRAAVDPRVLKAIELVRAKLRGPIAQDEVAGAVFLSPSRFRHLFVEETGMAFRPYVLWVRLQRALECVAAGEPLTEAALTAGFSDTAHMTRTFRQMFGITPGVLVRTAAHAE